MTGAQFRHFWKDAAIKASDWSGDVIPTGGNWATVASAFYRVSPRTVRRWAKLKRIPKRVLAAMP